MKEKEFDVFLNHFICTVAEKSLKLIAITAHDKVFMPLRKIMVRPRS